MLEIVRFNRGEPKFRCRVCGQPFSEDESRVYETHVIACANTHEADLRALSLRERLPALYDPEQSGDVDYGKWVRANRKAIIEGRLKM